MKIFFDTANARVMHRAKEYLTGEGIGFVEVSHPTKTSPSKPLVNKDGWPRIIITAHRSKVLRMLEYCHRSGDRALVTLIDNKF